MMKPPARPAPGRRGRYLGVKAAGCRASPAEKERRGRGTGPPITTTGPAPGGEDGKAGDGIGRGRTPRYLASRKPVREERKADQGGVLDDPTCTTPPGRRWRR